MTREEALQAIKAKMDYYESDRRLRGALETLIPELAESEDERIRKELLEVIRCCYENGGYAPLCTDDYKKYSAYLEKQKELPTNEEMLRTLRLEYEKGVADTIAKYEQKEQTEELSTRLNGVMQEYVKSGKDEEEQEHRLKCYHLFWDALGDSEFFKQKEPKSSIFPPGLGEVHFNPISCEQKEQKPILEVFGFKVGDAVRLKDGDGRKHIIKSFEEVEGIHGPNFYQVEFEDNSARDGIYPGEEYPNGYYTQMEKFEEEQKQTAKINGEPISTENYTVKVGDDETEVQKAYREGKNAGRKEVFDHPEEYGLQPRRMYDYETGKRNPEWSEDKFPKNIEADAVQFCFDNGINITPYQAKQIATHYLMVGHNEGYIEGRKNANIPAKELGLPSSMDFKQEWSEEDMTKLRDVVRMIEDSGHVKSTREHYEKFLNSLPERFNLRSESLKELFLEKAIKWFEDTFFFENHSSGRGEDYEISTQDFDSMEEMYDSFRKAVIADSEPLWKPSKGQMRALKSCVSGWLDNTDGNLESLYEDLQKRYGTC